MIIKIFRPIKLVGSNKKRYIAFFTNLVGEFPPSPSSAETVTFKETSEHLRSSFRAGKDDDADAAKKENEEKGAPSIFEHLSAFDFDLDGRISRVEWSAMPEAMMSVNTLQNGPIADAAESFAFWKRKRSERTPKEFLAVVASGAVDRTSAALYCKMALVDHSDEQKRCDDKVAHEWDRDADGFLSREEFFRYFEDLWNIVTRLNVASEVATFQRFIDSALDPHLAAHYVARAYGSCDAKGHTIVQERGIVMSVYVRALVTIAEGILLRGEPGSPPVTYQSSMHFLTPWEFREIGRWMATVAGASAATIDKVRGSDTLDELVRALRSDVSKESVVRATKMVAVDISSAIARLANHLDSQYDGMGSAMCDMHPGQLMVKHEYTSKGGGALRVKLLDLDAWRVVGSQGKVDTPQQDIGCTKGTGSACTPYYDCSLACTGEGTCVYATRHQMVDIFCRDVLPCALLPIERIENLKAVPGGITRDIVASICPHTPMREKSSNPGLQPPHDLVAKTDTLRQSFAAH